MAALDPSPRRVRDQVSHKSHDMDQRLLLACAQAGDERAFRRLVEPYRHALEVHCYRMLGSAQDAEDLVQETLLRAWRALERFEPRAQFQTWLYRIATNACLDELERRPRRPEPIDPFPDRPSDETTPPTYDPAARYAIREGMELALLRAIQELPGRQRAVLIFRDVLGWTAPEVAELLESTVASVNSALQRARATIDRYLPEPAPTRCGSDRARAAQPLCGCVRARRHGRAGGAAARGRDATDAAAAVAARWSPDRALLPRDRRPRRSDADSTPADLGQWPARGDDRSASRRWHLDPARDQHARDRGGPDRRDRRVSRPCAAAAVRSPGRQDRSNRSRFITLTHAAMKSCANFSRASSLA